MRQCYQGGCLRRTKRRAGPDRWEFLWRENDVTGKRVRRTTVIGTVDQYPTRELAQAEVNGLRMQINEDRLRQPGHDILVAELVDHYIQTELSEGISWHSHATRIIYRQFLTRWIRPHWGNVSIRSVRTVAVERWLRRLQRTNGIPLANATKAKIRNLLNVLFNHAIRYEWLGQRGKGCLLIYRRRAQDMPLAQPPENATPDQVAKTEATRLKMLRLAQEKYLFRVQDRMVPTGLLEENGRLVGLKVAETEVQGRKAELVAGSEYELRAPMVISSIGSVPEEIPGVSMKGEYYDFEDETLPRYVGSDHVFGVGNVVTGQGNIHSSLLHSQEVTTQLIENYIGVGDEDAPSTRFYAGAEARGAGQAQAVQARVQVLPGLSDLEIAAIERRIRVLQERVGYTGEYDSWIASVPRADTAGQGSIPTDIAPECTRQSSPCSAAFDCAPGC
jgi:hypothetical protein